MSVIIERGGTRYIQLTVQIPYDLRIAAKEQKISIASTLKRALEAELGMMTA